MKGSPQKGMLQEDREIEIARRVIYRSIGTFCTLSSQRIGRVTQK